jgi:hypothetical protein
MLIASNSISDLAVALDNFFVAPGARGGGDIKLLPIGTAEALP